MLWTKQQLSYNCHQLDFQQAVHSLTLISLRQVLQNVLNHSNKLSLVKAELGSGQNLDQGGIKAETNGGGRGGSSSGSESESSPVTPPESQSPLHFLADLAEQKSREEKKGMEDAF